MDYSDKQILQKNGPNTIPITMWNPHPIDMGVTQVGVDNGYPVEGSGDVIATGGGYDVAKVQVVGKGHVFLWGDEWVTYNSEWNDHPDYQVQLFWLNSIKWLTVAVSAKSPSRPTRPNDLSWRAGRVSCLVRQRPPRRRSRHAPRGFRLVVRRRACFRCWVEPHELGALRIGDRRVCGIGEIDQADGHHAGVAVLLGRATQPSGVTGIRVAASGRAVTGRAG